ncbi:MAG: filamentous hemagglutinin N-terminal domain-containing protein, partial [Rickettsiales bacterium]
MRTATKATGIKLSNKAWATSSTLYRTAFASVAALAAATANDAMALPTGAQVESGDISISQPTGTDLIVNQGSDRAVINWQNFDILHGESTRFNQPGANSIALNRVRDGNPTQILGKLSANGKLVLVNPNGVFFGAGSTVDVAGMIATTADTSTANFNAGKLQFDRAGNPDAVIENRGTITAAEGGLVALIAPKVIQGGIIQAKAGTVALASGRTATIDMYGDDLYSFAVGTDGKGVSNTGKITAGNILMTANAAKDVVTNVVNNTGVLEASGAHMDGGTIVLDGGSSGKVSVAGSVKATGKKGGTVTVTGKN